MKPRGLGRSKSLGGETRLCLTASSLILVKLGAHSDLPSVTIPLLSVRRFGHLDGLFFLELGRSAPDGPGEIWMEAGDQGSEGYIHNPTFSNQDGDPPLHVCSVQGTKALPSTFTRWFGRQSTLCELFQTSASRRPPTSLKDFCSQNAADINTETSR